MHHVRTRNIGCGTFTNTLGSWSAYSSSANIHLVTSWNFGSCSRVIVSFQIRSVCFDWYQLATRSSLWIIPRLFSRNIFSFIRRARQAIRYEDTCRCSTYTTFMLIYLRRGRGGGLASAGTIWKKFSSAIYLLLAGNIMSYLHIEWWVISPRVS